MFFKDDLQCLKKNPASRQSKIKSKDSSREKQNQAAKIPKKILKDIAGVSKKIGEALSGSGAEAGSLHQCWNCLLTSRNENI